MLHPIAVPITMAPTAWALYSTEELEALHARYLERVRAIDHPPAYGRFPALLEARGKNAAGGSSEGAP